MKLCSCLIVALAICAPALPAGQDLRFSYHSSIDDTDQPYRVYVPSSYRPGQPIPLAFVLHGTGHDENNLFDDEAHYPAANGIKNAAEQNGILAVSPYGRGTAEYRGIGENDIFCVLADVKRRFAIDEDRIYLTGHSMGGTGAAYIGLHRPDLFAAVAPLAAAGSFPRVAANAGHLPFQWTGGSLDAEYYKLGVAVGVERMRNLGCPVEFVELPGEGHYGTAKDFKRVFSWLVQHQRVAHPESFTFEVDTPLHPRAYWTTVEAIARPGKVATVRGRAVSGRSAQLNLENVASISFWPDPAVFKAGQDLEIVVDETRAFSGRLSATQEVKLTRGEQGWKSEIQPRKEISLTAYRSHPVTFAPESLDHSGIESRLANWITDAMRWATGADIALYNRGSYRGLPIPAGTVDVVDLLQCNRPWDKNDLITTELTGRDIMQILDANVQDSLPTTPGAMDLLVQVSGAKYTFNRGRPRGERIVSSTFEADRVYRVVLEQQVVERESIRLAGRFKKLKYHNTQNCMLVVLYGYAAQARELHAALEGRVVERK